jgi:hypothetical protein
MPAVTIPGRYQKQPVNRVGQDYSGKLLQPVLTEMDRELRRLRAQSEELLSSGIAPANAQYLTLAVDAELTGERVLTMGSDRLTLVDAGANSTATLDASMASTSWDFLRGVSIYNTDDVVSLDVKPSSGQTASALRVLQNADGIRMFQVDASGTVTVGDTAHTDNIVMFQIRVPVSKVSSNIMQVVKATGGSPATVTLFSVGFGGAFVLGTGGSAFNSNLTHFTINPGPSQSQSILTVRNPTNAFSLWALDTSGRMVIANSAISSPKRFTTFDRADGGDTHVLTWPDTQGGAGTFLSNDGSGNMTWSAPTVVELDLFNQASSIATTNLMTGQPTDAYEVEVIASCTTVSASGTPTLDVILGWTDGVTSTTVEVLSATPLFQRGRAHGTIVVRSSGNITYGTNINDPQGAERYSLNFRVTRL